MSATTTIERTLEFKERVQEWAARVRVEPEQLRVQEMRRKWASCSTKGWVTFARDLLDEPRTFQDYVIVHELLHLRYRNHGKLFVAALRSYLASNKAVRAEKAGVHCMARRAS